MDFIKQMKEVPKRHDHFIGFDSDGCVFDTMEIKHKECFCPAFIKHFNLQAGSKYGREVWEFVNLYSKTRGYNRFLAVQESFRLINQRPEFFSRGIAPLDYSSLQQWIKEETRLGNPALQAKVEVSFDVELQTLLDWSSEVNQRIADMVFGIPPFPGVEEVLKTSRKKADLIVVSQTPMEALEREWRENCLDQHLQFICGQECGTKAEHLQYCAGGKYEKKKILMVGDAPGDLAAARANQALFCPIVPGREEVSWRRLADEGLDRFFKGAYDGDYQESLLEEFEQALPAKPPWSD